MGLLSALRCSECSGAFGVGVGIFCWWFGFFFVNLQKCNVLEEIFEIFLII